MGEHVSGKSLSPNLEIDYGVMAKQGNPNIEILSAAVERLGAVADEMVFLGGCATGLLITDPAAPSIRITTDVDVITARTGSDQAN